jgi:hypothetical protein
MLFIHNFRAFVGFITKKPKSMKQLVGGKNCLVARWPKQERKKYFFNQLKQIHD